MSAIIGIKAITPNTYQILAWTEDHELYHSLFTITAKFKLNSHKRCTGGRGATFIRAKRKFAEPISNSG